MSTKDLVINGGAKIRQKPWPARKSFGSEEKAAAMRLFDQSIASGNPIIYGGPEEDAYCKAFVTFQGMDGYCDAVNSGSTAVYIALRALDIEPFSEVIVGAVTDPGGIMPIPLLNLIPMVADTTPDSYNSGPAQIEPLITKRTRAIVVAHIAGEPLDIEPIAALAKKHNLYLIEDCAQSHGAMRNGRKVGTFGDIAAFSTMFGKSHSTGGHGGLVYTRNAGLYQKIRWASDRGKPFGLAPDAGNQIAALNYNQDDLGCAIGVEQLKKLPGINESRRAIVKKFDTAFRSLKSVSVPKLADDAYCVYWFLRTRFNASAVTCDKKTFVDALIAEGLPLQPTYSRDIPHRRRWFTERRVFGTSGYPWASPDYKGDKNAQFPCPNSLAVDDAHFIISINEGWDDEAVNDAVAIIKKVETAYKK